MTGQGQWMNVGEVAKQLEVSTQTVRRLIKDGDLPAYQLREGSWFRVKREDLEKFLTQRQRGFDPSSGSQESS